MKPLLIDCIPTGKENAVKCSELAKIFECNEREISLSINALRNDGVFICSDSDGYYKPSDDEDIKRFVKQMQSRITEIKKAVQPAEDYLKGAEANA